MSLQPCLRRRVPTALSVLALCSLACEGPPTPESLPLDRPAVRGLDEGSSEHRYSIDIEPGQVIHVAVEQRELDVVLDLVDPSDRVLLKVDSQSGVWGTETFWWAASTPGRYEVRIRPWTRASSGDYRLEARLLQTFSRTTAQRVKASRLLHGGEQGLERDLSRAWEQAIRILRNAGDGEQEVLALMALANLQGREGRLDEELATYETARHRAGELGLSKLEVIVLHRLGTAHRRRQDPAEVGRALESALELSIASEDPWNTGVSRRYLARLALETGDLRVALQLGRSAVRDLEDTRDEFERASALHGLGFALTQTGRRREALELYSEAQHLRERIGDRPGLADSLIEIGWIHYLEDRPEEAIQFYTRALGLHRRLGNRQGRAGVLDRLGSARRALGQWDQARDRYRESLDLTRQLGNQRDQVHTLCNLAELELATGRPEQALRALDRADRIAWPDSNAEVHGLSLRSQAHAELGDISEALRLSKQVLHRLETIDNSLAIDSFQIPYFSVRRQYLDHHLELLTRLHLAAPTEGWDHEAFLQAEHWRARGLLRRIAVERGPRPGQEARRARIRTQLSEAALERERAVPRSPGASRLEARLRQLTEELGETRRLALPGDGPSRWAPGDRAKLVDSESLLLVFHLGESRSWLWVSGPERLEQFVLPPGAELEQAARDLYRSTKGSQHLAFRARADADATRLGSLLLGPIEQRLDDQRLIIVPDGALHYVPFGALRLPSRPDPLIAHHEVVKSPSLAVLQLLRDRARDRRSALLPLAIVADPIFQENDPRVHRPSGGPGPETNPVAETLLRAGSEFGMDPLSRLPASAEEASSIAELVPSEDEVLVALGSAAARSLVLEGTLSQYRILHFATHGLLHPSHSELSGLVLSMFDATGQPQNGYLRAFEVSSLDLSADLVVLSACQSALGLEMRGEGLLGLPRSFFQAGATQVVVSLWQVEDEATAAFMEHFYQGLLEHRRSPAAALRSSQRWMAEETPWTEPFYWAAFELQGDWEGKNFRDL